jgi:phage recombination protein Bet
MELQKTLVYTKDQIELIKTQIAPEATMDELKLFLYQAQRTGLDALSRQIYCIHRNTKLPNGSYGKKMTIQTSIDGFRVIAERSGTYAGQSEPVFTYNSDGQLMSCKISVFRFKGDIRYEAAVGIAYWDEYVQTDKNGNPIGLWGSKPRIMLAKVCESIALRKAFPQDLSGLYTGDEMPEEVSEKPFYIKAHPTVEDLEMAIDLCLSVQELRDLYKLNMHLDNETTLQLFTSKKETL